MAQRQEDLKRAKDVRAQVRSAKVEAEVVENLAREMVDREESQRRYILKIEEESDALVTRALIREQERVSKVTRGAQELLKRDELEKTRALAAAGAWCHYISTMASLYFYYGVTIFLLWRHYISTMASLYFYYGVTIFLL